MRTERGFARLVGFSDGVVAIAITLLILPLVTSAAESKTDALTFIGENTFPLFAFVLSFLVIGRFWMVHHGMYENAIAYSPALLWANLLWLLTIVFLPLPTEMIGSTDRVEPLTHGLYVGTMALTSAAALLQQWIIMRDPSLHSPDAKDLRLLPFVSILLIMLVALVFAVLFPGVGLLALLLLFLATPVEKLIDRRRKKTTA